MTERWLLERAMALLEAVLRERDRHSRRLVVMPPEGATLHEIERAALVAALDRANWVQRDAARLLGMTPRVMFYKMVRYDLYQDHPSGPKQRRVQVRRKPLATKPPARRPGRDWRLNVEQC